MSRKLQVLRKKIDFIDNELLTLLEKRQAIVQEVGELKEVNGDNCFIKPDREELMLRSLCNRTSIVPHKLIIRIWRSIISSALVTEKEFVILALADKLHTQALVSLNLYFSGQVAIKTFADLADLKSDFSINSYSVIAVVAGDELFDILETPQNKIFAALGNGKDVEDKLFLIAQIPVDNLAEGEVYYILKGNDFEGLESLLEEKKKYISIVVKNREDKKFLIKAHGIVEEKLGMMLGSFDCSVNCVGSSGEYASW